MGGLLGWFWESPEVTAFEGERFACLRSPQVRYSQFGSQCFGVHVIPADFLDGKHLRHAPKFFVRRVVVRSHITCVG